MPITKDEAARLSRRCGLPKEDFCFENEQGILTLLNNESTRACVFLLTNTDDPSGEGMCSVYEIRPKGCTTYPIVLNQRDEAILDEGCPYRSEFEQPDDDDAMVLLNLEEELLRE